MQINMEHTIKRLEHIITQQKKELREVKQENQKLLSKIQQNQQQVLKISDTFKHYHHDDYKNIFLPKTQPSQDLKQIGNKSETIKALECKIEVLNWQVLELQSMNFKYQQTILGLQKQIFLKQSQETIYKNHNKQLSNSIEQIKSEKQDQLTYINQIMEKWKQSVEQKGRLLKQNQRLKNMISHLKQQSNRNISDLINENNQLRSKIQIISSIEKQRLDQFTKTAESIKEQNKKLQQSLNEKNKIINLYCVTPEGKQLSTSKINDLHTIRSLKDELTRKGRLIQEILQRMKVIQETHRMNQGLQNKCKKIKDQIQAIESQNRSLKDSYYEISIQLQQKSRTISAYKKNIQDEEQKIYELLLQNQACHELLFKVKGSKVYLRDVSEKVQMILKDLESRRMQEERWTDITELIQVNRRLRMHRCF